MIKKILLILTALMNINFCLATSQSSADENEVYVIFINGSSSAGKSSVALALQEILDEPYLNVGVDGFLKALPKQYRPGGAKAKEGYDFVRIESNSHPEVKVEFGKVGKKLLFSMNGALLRLAEDGFSLIVDHVMIFEGQCEEFKQQFKDFSVVTIKVWAPLEILEEREVKRKGVPGLARATYDAASRCPSYDLELNTSKLSPSECAKKIKSLIEQRKRQKNRLERI